MNRLTLMTQMLGMSIALLRTTLRVELLNSEYYADLQARRVPVLFALWHGRMFLPIDAHRHEGIATMASKSRDGNIITRWLENNGYLVTRGSTTRGGSEALRRMVRHVRSGHNVALTVDGPKGPAGVVQSGIVRLARITDAWILPISFSSSLPLFLRSWDHYLLPKPFSRNVVAYGEPFAVPQEMSDEVALAKISAALNQVTAAADSSAGARPPS
ncbi:MAG TPA: lysophospholipid acyltransferase family protein [Candidatus Binatus sp.]|nr:lysophospholipid acyltransferase family protein [Candidatus Binatus sp.]